MKWKPIVDAPRDTKKMYVVKAIDVKLPSGKTYTSDPYCVWHTKGSFIRWPHEFKPTHFCLLPEDSDVDSD